MIVFAWDSKQACKYLQVELNARTCFILSQFRKTSPISSTGKARREFVNFVFLSMFFVRMVFSQACKDDWGMERLEGSGGAASQRMKCGRFYFSHVIELPPLET